MVLFSEYCESNINEAAVCFCDVKLNFCRSQYSLKQFKESLCFQVRKLESMKYQILWDDMVWSTVNTDTLGECTACSFSN